MYCKNIVQCDKKNKKHLLLFYAMKFQKKIYSLYIYLHKQLKQI